MLDIVTRVQGIQARLRSLVALQLELAKLEVRGKAKTLAIAAAFGIVALVLMLYALGFALAALAAGFAADLSLWVALLCVAGVALLGAAVLGLVAARMAKRAAPARPAETVEEAQRTAEALRSHA